tara:strand:- start:2599 stop:2982 length:384 start_codon:yes stop_codon:yes gene_type:complete
MTNPFNASMIDATYKIEAYGEFQLVRPDREDGVVTITRGYIVMYWGCPAGYMESAEDPEIEQYDLRTETGEVIEIDNLADQEQVMEFARDCAEFDADAQEALEEQERRKEQWWDDIDATYASMMGEL